VLQRFTAPCPPGGRGFIVIGAGGHKSFFASLYSLTLIIKKRRQG